MSTNTRMQFARRLLLCVFSVLAAVYSCPSRSDVNKTISKKRVYWNPHRKVRAIVVYYKPRLYGIGESRVDIRDKQGRLLASRDYACGGTQGYRVKKVAWTSDSRFLVFSMINAGGHSPWRSPTHFYDVRRHKFYSVDALVMGSAVTDVNFTIMAPARLVVVGRDDKKITLNLRSLGSAKRKKAEAEERSLWLHLQSEKWRPST